MIRFALLLCLLPLLSGKSDPRLPYIQTWLPVAKTMSAKYRVPVSVQLAQAILESASGQSSLCQQTKNHFGMQCKLTKHTGKCCIQWNDAGIIGRYCQYDTNWQSWSAHAQHVTSGRYADLPGLSVKAWCDGLQKLGYARDPNYSSKLQNLIKQYELQKYDK